MSVFLLGPSKWAQGFTPPPLPHWLLEYVPSAGSPAVPPSPLEIRKALASLIAAGGHHVVVMESYPDVPGEPNVDKFARLVSEQGITQFALYWPFGANRSGLDVEIGLVLERLRRKEIIGRNVRVLVEDDGVHRRAGEIKIDKNDDITFVSYEVGRRNRYYDDWLPYQAIITTWTDYSELREILENISVD